MPLSIGYMGTKRQLAPALAQLLSLAPSGPMLDLFSGMCAVATQVAPSRQIWCNDVQHFAAQVAAAFFTAIETPISSRDLIEHVGREFRRNAETLKIHFATELCVESAALDSGDPERIASTDDRAPNIATSRCLDRERVLLARFPKAFPYRLFSTTFSGAYFGLSQSIEIDSIRFAIDELLAQKVVRREQHRWMLLALCQASSKVANTTGHFAQYLKVKKSNVSRFVHQRRRSVWSEWQDAIRTVWPFGSKSWRRRNHVFQAEALSLLHHLRTAKRKPSVIYADPPYTADHYSRFYHVYETLIRYDYPQSIGVGRYRPDRFTSTFSLAARVADEIELLVKGCSSVGAELVLSYPQNGLLENSERKIPRILRKYYSHCESHRIEHSHSSLGASKGFEKRPVTEIVYRAN
jgi:adenine-specific DNA-methyltransferase